LTQTFSYVPSVPAAALISPDGRAQVTHNGSLATLRGSEAGMPARVTPDQRSGEGAEGRPCRQPGDLKEQAAPGQGGALEEERDDAWLAEPGAGDVLEESLVRLVDTGAVPGGEQIQQQAADHGHAEPGVGPGRPFVGAGLDQGVGDRRDP
jgi:hypothetical protein